MSTIDDRMNTPRTEHDPRILLELADCLLCPCLLLLLGERPGGDNGALVGANVHFGRGRHNVSVVMGDGEKEWIAHRRRPGEIRMREPDRAPQSTAPGRPL